MQEPMTSVVTEKERASDAVYLYSTCVGSRHTVNDMGERKVSDDTRRSQKRA